MSYKREVILNTFQELVFQYSGNNLSSVKDLRADASDRKIYRLFAGNKSFIGVYNDNEKENLAFINFTNAFVKMGLNVPEVLRVSEDKLFYIEEDLGDLTLYSFMLDSKNSGNMSYYRQSLKDLLTFQIEAKDKIDFSNCYQTDEFNIDVIISDLQKFEDCFLYLFPESNFNNTVRDSIIKFSENILRNVRKDFFLYRDFQPRNIMLKDNKLYYIDYQSGRKGPMQYDVASFLYSGSINVTEDERIILLNYYLDESKSYLKLEKKDFLNCFYFFVFQRLLQMLGSYAYLYQKKNNRDVLKKIPKALSNLKSLVNKIDNHEINEFIKHLTISNL